MNGCNFIIRIVGVDETMLEVATRKIVIFNSSSVNFLIKSRWSTPMYNNGHFLTGFRRGSEWKKFQYFCAEGEDKYWAAMASHTLLLVAAWFVNSFAFATKSLCMSRHVSIFYKKWDANARVYDSPTQIWKYQWNLGAKFNESRSFLTD